MTQICVLRCTSHVPGPCGIARAEFCYLGMGVGWGLGLWWFYKYIWNTIFCYIIVYSPIQYCNKKSYLSGYLRHHVRRSLWWRRRLRGRCWGCSVSVDGPTNGIKVIYWPAHLHNRWNWGKKSQCGIPFWNSNQCIGYWALIRVMWMLIDRSQHEEHWSLGRVPLRSWVVDMFHSFNPLFSSLGKMYNFEICISQKICKKCFSTPIFRQNRTLVCSPLPSSSSPLAASYTICSWPLEKNSNWFKIIVHSKNICSSNILYSNIILSVCHGDQSINQSIVIVLLADQRNWRIWTERLIRRRWPRLRLCMYHNIDYPASR